jgi:hypothetical protein
LGVLPPLWSSAAMKPLPERNFSAISWFMGVLPGWIASEPQA